MKNQIKQLVVLLAFIVGTLAVGYLSSLATAVSIKSAYAVLVKPSFFPPAWVFAPVWTILYTLMGISAYLVWKTKENIKAPMSIFAIQLFFNFLWTIIFFGMGQYLLAFIEIILLLALIVLTMVSFSKRSKVAAWILLPYLLWVSFASILNLTIWLIN